MTWRATDPQGAESLKVKYDIVPYTRGIVLDLGCGPHKAFPHFVGMDSGKDTELFNIAMKVDVLCDDLSSIDDKVQEQSVDAIFSSHLLEHIDDYKGTLDSWWKAIKPGGHLVLYLPHRDFYPRIGTEGSNPDHKHDFGPQDIVDAMKVVGNWDLLVNEPRNEDMEYSFLQVYRKFMPGPDGSSHGYPYLAPKPPKTACVVRYGGFGDQIQASNILPELKRQGYHVTVMTTPKGEDILRHDPHIDAFFIQDTNQVPNGELSAFWEVQVKHYDKFINLSESVEATMLAMPGRANHAWPKSVRDKYLDINYLEFTAELAEIPYTSEAKFYPTKQEEARALAVLRADDPGRRFFNVLWALAGSSVHKFWPGQDMVIARILEEMPDARVILVGDEACKILEAGWEENPRVLCTSGEMSIRDTLVMAQQVNLVIGPETGVLNAVAFDYVPKICLLSHSSRENLTKHWVNATPLSGAVPCYPCHQLHYTTKYCPTDAETGAALCQMAIQPDDVYGPAAWAYTLWKTKQAGIAA
jgi:ADP-heptose:LPS heptosyltransferase/predicted SAM-dependent methyltransferase